MIIDELLTRALMQIANVFIQLIINHVCQIEDFIAKHMMWVHVVSAVRRTYLEVAYRYAQVLQEQQALIPGVLRCYLSAVTHSSASVRSRACYLFLRVLKTLRSQVGTHLSDLMQALQPLLLAALPHEGGAGTALEHQDRLFLCEAADNAIVAEGLALDAAQWCVCVYIYIYIDR